MTTRKIPNPELFRKNICEKLNLIILDEKKSKHIERGIYNFSLKESNRLKVVKKWDNSFFVQIYIDRLRSIFINLNDNNELLEKLKTGVINSREVETMTHYDFKPSKWVKMIEEKTIRDKNKYEQKMVASTNVFKCRKCGSRETTYTSIQTRSCDEPTTNFVSCITCGNNWKC